MICLQNSGAAVQKGRAIPDLSSDLIDITPHCNKDVDACDFEGGYDAFGVKWIPTPNNPDMPSFVETGFIVLDDIENWEDLKFPDIESWPWKEYAERYNRTYKDDGRLKRGVILSGYFERLISLMTFEEAAVSLITDPDSVSAVFEKLTDINIQQADHYIDDFGCEMIMIHDDWASQRSPFFSLDVCTEVIVPHLKRLVDHVHAKGALFELHSCGNGEKLVPAMKAAGIDMWQAQGNAIQHRSTYEAVGDSYKIELISIDIPDGLHGEALESFVREKMLEYNSPYRSCTTFYNYDPTREEETRKVLYKVGREVAAVLQKKDA